MRTKLLKTQLEDVERLEQIEDLPNYSLPGAGKTLTTIGSLERKKANNGLVIGPVISLPMWARSLEYELGAKVQLIKTGAQKLDRTADFWVTSYGVAVSRQEELMTLPSGPLVLDESQALSNPDSKRTMAVYGPATDGTDGLYQNSTYCYTLTGTPMERYIDDMWPQLRAIQPQLLADHGVLDYEDFLERFTRRAMKQYNPRMRAVLTVVGSRNEHELHRMLYDELGVIRRKVSDMTADGQALPVGFREVTMRATLTPEIRAMMHGLTVHQMAEALQKDLEVSTKLRRLIGMAKLNDVAEYVAECSLAGQVLVGFWHTEFSTALMEQLKRIGRRVAIIDGSTPVLMRDVIAGDFNEGKIDVLLGQIEAAGVSLNLQSKCRHVIFGELHWSAAKVEQFFKRVLRYGQQQFVQVDYCVSETTIDDAQMFVLGNKQMGANKVFSETDNYFRNLNAMRRIR